jgi:hypothetical protein
MTMMARLSLFPRWIAFGLLVLMCGCGRNPSEQALLDAIGSLQQSIENRDAGALEDRLAEDFVGSGGLDRAAARRVAAVNWLRHDRIGVTLGPLESQVRDKHATVRFTAALTGGSGRLLPDAAQVYDVETGWRFDDGEWRVTSATWRPRL